MSDKELIPVPDPTERTTENLLREVRNVREVIETRLNGMDKAIELLQRTTDKFPEQIVQAVDQLKELHTEKFASIATQFVERDTRSEQTARDSKVAVDAALKAQQEAFSEQSKSSALAIAKSEAATTKQIDLLGNQRSTDTSNLNDKIDDLKARVTGFESYKKGGSEGLGAAGAIVIGVFGIIGVIVGAIALVIAYAQRGGP